MIMFFTTEDGGLNRQTAWRRVIPLKLDDSLIKAASDRYLSGFWKYMLLSFCQSSFWISCSNSISDDAADLLAIVTELAEDGTGTHLHII